MIRALITAALLAGAAMHFFGAQADVAIGYSLVPQRHTVVLLAAAAPHRPPGPSPAPPPPAQPQTEPGRADTTPHPDQPPPPLLRTGAPGGTRGGDAAPRLQPPGTAPAHRGTKSPRRDLRHHRHRRRRHDEHGHRRRPADRPRLGEPAADPGLPRPTDSHATSPPRSRPRHRRRPHRRPRGHQEAGPAHPHSAGIRAGRGRRRTRIQQTGAAREPGARGDPHRRRDRDPVGRAGRRQIHHHRRQPVDQHHHRDRIATTAAQSAAAAPRHHPVRHHRQRRMPPRPQLLRLQPRLRR